ncbi:MAG: hypothetical protein K2N06_02090 [Oscillospiraceae bacterium]|nr:hypothetical protein [Oscillospiraceae bacterium]
MWNVSSDYIKAVQKPDREFKILVRFNYKDGTQAEFNDSNIIGDSDVEIASQAISGSASCDKIDIGAAIAAKASLSIIDNDVNLHRYTGSSFEIYVYLKLENGKFFEVPMGRFYTDSSQLSRLKNKINIVGYDSMLSLMYALTDEHRRRLKGSTAVEAVQFLAAYSNCGFEQDLSRFPNNGIPLDFDSPQVETARDGIMWIAQLLGCFAHINRLGYLEFVPIESIWSYYNEEHTLGTIHVVRNINSSERFKTTFSDDRIHIVSLSMPDRNNNLITCGGGGLKDDANITVALDRNPLVINSSISLKDILNAILSQVRTTYFYAFKTEIIGDPAFDAGDTIRLKGGVINGTNKNNDLIGFITHNVWRYRGHHEITNAGQVPIVYAESETATAALASDTANLADSDNDLFYLPPKSQAEKAVAGAAEYIDRITDHKYTEIIAGDCMRDGSFAVNEAAGINFYSRLSSHPIPYRPSAITEKLPYASIGISDLNGDSGTQFEITHFTEYGLDANGSLIKYYNRIRFDRGHLLYEVHSPYDSKTIDLFGSVQKDYVDAQDESYFEQSKKHSDDAISSHNTDESAHSYIQGKIRSVQNSIHEVENRVSDLESGGTGGGYYTTKIAFKEGGFALTFENQNGDELVNEFMVTESGGNITKITNITAGKEIEVTYE